MATEVTMPKLGFDMEEGAIASWLKQEGDPVAAGEVIAEVETDKATVEMEAPAGGVLLKILVEPGTFVPVNTAVAYIGEEGEAVEGAEEDGDVTASAPEEPAPEPDGARATPVARRLAEEHELTLESIAGTGPGGRVTRDDVERALAAAPAAEDEALPPPGGVKASPAARRRARELQLDLQQVEGTGPGGRVVIEDVETFAARAPAAPKPVEPAAVEPAAVEVQPVGAADEIELTRMRRRIGQIMTASKSPVPHFYVTMSVDMDEAMALRQEMNATLEDEGIKISVNDLILKAAALALREFPNVNASFAGDTIIHHGDINIGVAVAVEDGLLTVVVRHADTKALSQIATEAREKALRARDGRVQPDDLGGSTFTVSNLGMYGVDNFIAIITPPETAILAVGAVQEKPVVRDGELTVGSVLQVTLSADHRVTDGAEAAEFLVAFRTLLENPMRLML